MSGNGATRSYYKRENDRMIRVRDARKDKDGFEKTWIIKTITEEINPKSSRTYHFW